MKPPTLSLCLFNVIITILVISCSTSRRAPVTNVSLYKEPSNSDIVSEEEVRARLIKLRSWYYEFVFAEGELELYVLPFKLNSFPSDTLLTKEFILKHPLTVNQKWDLLQLLRTEVAKGISLGPKANLVHENNTHIIQTTSIENRVRELRSRHVEALVKYFLPKISSKPTLKELGDNEEALTTVLYASLEVLEMGIQAESKWNLPGIIDFDPWGEWQILRHSNEFQRYRYFLFKNGPFAFKECPKNDLLCKVGKIEEISDIDPEVLSLVDFIWLRDSAHKSLIQLPKDLQNFVKKEFSKLKKSVPPPYLKFADDIVLIMDDTRVPIQFNPKKNFTNPEFFWFNTVLPDSSQNPYSLLVSPVLIRAAFLNEVGSPGDVYDLLEFETLLDTGTRTIEDLHFVSSRMIRRFIESLRFSFAHELAHKYLDQDMGGTENNEQRVDCYALWHLKKADLWAGLGIFDDMMMAAIDEGTANRLWRGQELQSNLYARLKRLKEIESALKKAPPAQFCDNYSEL